MTKAIIIVLGRDRPGIICLVSNILYELGCNLENAHQMILQQQFAGFFIVELPLKMDIATLSKELKTRTRKSGLIIHANLIEDDDTRKDIQKSELFLITTIGPDQKGLVARFSKILARFNANIENLKAVFKGGNDPLVNIMSYQVSITPDIDTDGLFKALRKTADQLNLDVRIQHRNIFDAINKI